MKIPEILQVETPQVPGSLASVLNVIAESGLVLEHVTTVHRDQGRTLWEITLEIEEGRQEELLKRLNALPIGPVRRLVGPRVRPPSRRQDRDALAHPDLHAADPAGHLHARRGARVPRHPEGSGEGRSSTHICRAPWR